MGQTGPRDSSSSSSRHSRHLGATPTVWTQRFSTLLATQPSHASRIKPTPSGPCLHSIISRDHDRDAGRADRSPTPSARQSHRHQGSRPASMDLTKAEGCAAEAQARRASRRDHRPAQGVPLRRSRSTRRLQGPDRGRQVRSCQGQTLLDQKTTAVQSPAPKVLTALANFHVSPALALRQQVRERLDKRHGRLGVGLM